MSNSYHRDFPISWAELHRDARALAWRLLDGGPWEGIAIITRGGLVPAAIIARELNLRLIDTICVSSYEGGDMTSSQGEMNVLKGMELENGGARWIVVDDLVDTGSTLKLVRKMLPNAHIATVYAKAEGKPMVDTFITEVSQDTWIRFPWDMEMNYATPLADRRSS